MMVLMIGPERGSVLSRSVSEGGWDWDPALLTSEPVGELPPLTLKTLGFGVSPGHWRLREGAQ